MTLKYIKSFIFVPLVKLIALSFSFFHYFFELMNKKILYIYIYYQMYILWNMNKLKIKNVKEELNVKY